MIKRQPGADDAPAVAVRRVKFSADGSGLGWIAAADDRTTNVTPPARGIVSQIFASVGQAVAKDAPLFAIRSEPSGANSASQDIIVTAPAAGTVTALAVSVGQAVKPEKDAAPAASIADLSSLWLVADTEENDAPALRPDQEVEVRPTAMRGKVFTGKVAPVLIVRPQRRPSRKRTLRQRR